MIKGAPSEPVVFIIDDLKRTHTLKSNLKENGKEKEKKKKK